MIRPCLHLVGLAILAVFGLGLASCAVSSTEVLQRQDLFTIQLGKMEDAIDLFQVEGIKSAHKNSLYMRNGFFYLGNGNSNKVMEFSSFGDLVGLIYNPQDNGKPVLMGETAEAGRISNKNAVPYNFQDIGEVAITRGGILLVEDTTSDSKRVIDSRLGTVLNHIVLRFSKQGRFLDYLGQEGIGGAPFPYIESIHVTNSDDIVIICRTTRQWLAFWYSAQGQRKFAVAIPLDKLPIPSEGQVIPALKALKPDVDFPQLYLHIDYYPANPAQVKQPVKSRVYTLSLSSGSYETFFSLPQESQALGQGGPADQVRIQSLPEFLGEVSGGKFFFVSRSAEDQHTLTILDRSGRVIHSRILRIEDSKLVDSSLVLSNDGVISGFFGFEDHAQVVWWRADSLLGASF